MATGDNKLISLEHLSIVKNYIDTKCNDLSTYCNTLDNRIGTNTLNINEIRNDIADLNFNNASSDINSLQNRISLIERCDMTDVNFEKLGLYTELKKLNDSFDKCDSRITLLEGKTDNDNGGTDSGNIDETTLIKMINTPAVLTGIMSKDVKFGQGLINFIKDNGTIDASKLTGSIPSSKIGSIPMTKLTGTLTASQLPASIPFSKIDATSNDIMLPSEKSFTTNTTTKIWKLNGDGSGEITSNFKWDANGAINIDKVTVGKNFQIGWNNISDADSTLSEIALNNLKAQLGESLMTGDSLELEAIKNNYLGNSVGIRRSNDGSEIFDKKNNKVVTTVTDLLGDKIGILKYTKDASGNTTNIVDVDTDSKPIFSTVSSVFDELVGEVKGVKQIYDASNKLTEIKYGDNVQQISTASKFDEIEKAWIGEEFKPSFQVINDNGTNISKQTSQTVADVLKEIKTDWIGDGFGVETEHTVADEFNIIKIDWIGERYTPAFNGTTRTNKNVSEDIDLLNENLATTNATIATIADELNNELDATNLRIDASNASISNVNKAVTELKASYDTHVDNAISTFSDLNNRMTAVEGRAYDKQAITETLKTVIKDSDALQDIIISNDVMTAYVAEQLSKYPTTDVVDAKLDNYVSQNSFIEYKNETLNKFNDYATITKLETEVTKINNTLTSTYLTSDTANSTYLGKSATAVAATKATRDGNDNIIASTYATISNLTNGTLTVKNATSAESATKATQDSTGAVIANTYVKLSDYNALLERVSTLESKLATLEAKINQ